MTTAELVEIGDLDALLVRIDHLCADHEWAAIEDLRTRSRRAIERGRQLWPAASHAEYRLALEAPGSHAAAVLVPGAGRFAPGPLAEVAASTHTWAELCPHMSATPEAGMVAQERVARGEDLTEDAGTVAEVLELPLRLQPWEPLYPAATYLAYEIEEPEGADLPSPEMERIELPEAPHGGDDLEAEAKRALAELAMRWSEESNGSVEVVAVRGEAASGIATLDVAGVALMAVVTPAEAFAAMAAAAASGGAHGRRRGVAYGRFSAWWAAAAVADRLDHWPLEDDEIGDLVHGLRWFLWAESEASGGWALRIAVEDPARGLAWAVRATDHA